MELDKSKRYYYLSTWGANIHHFVIVIIALYMLINPKCKDPYPFQHLSDDVCLMQVDKDHVRALLITSSYLTYDFIVQYFLVADFGPLGVQTMVHHVIVPLGTLSGIITGYGVTAVGMILLLVEISTIFLNYRSFYKKE